jgi:hypothetical protein
VPVEVVVVVVTVGKVAVDEVVERLVEVEVEVCVCVTVVGALLSVKTIWPLLSEEQEPKLRLLVSPVYPVFTHDGTITFPL